MLVSQAIGFSKPVQGDVGIEIEVESFDPLPVNNINRSYFHAKRDGSLRNNGVEYTTTSAVTLNQTFRDNLSVLCSTINNSGNVDHNSIRTSVHTHVNVTHLTLSELWAGVCAQWLIEDLLVEYSGPDRVSNLFCLRLRDAEGVLGYVAKDLKASIPFQRHLITDQIRYSATNLNAIPKFGSVETRCMKGSTDPVLIYDWAFTLNNIMNKGASYKNPSNLLDAYFKMDRKEFILSLMPESSFKSIVEPVYGWSDLVEEQASRIAHIAYFHKWDAWETKIEKGFEKAKKNSVPPLFGDEDDDDDGDIIEDVVVIEDDAGLAEIRDIARMQEEFARLNNPPRVAAHLDQWGVRVQPNVRRDDRMQAPVQMNNAQQVFNPEPEDL